MNRHQRLAILMAPFLTVAAYIATDYYLQATSNPIVAESQALPLSLYKSCDLYNDICQLTQKELGLKLRLEANSKQLSLSTNLALDSVILAFNTQQPQRLQQQKDPAYWTMALTENTPIIKKIRLVIVIAKRHYFAEIKLSSVKNNSILPTKI